MPVVEEETLPEEILNATPEEIMTRVRLIDNDLKVSSTCWSGGGGREQVEEDAELLSALEAYARAFVEHSVAVGPAGAPRLRSCSESLARTDNEFSPRPQCSTGTNVQALFCQGSCW